MQRLTGHGAGMEVQAGQPTGQPPRPLDNPRDSFEEEQPSPSTSYPRPERQGCFARLRSALCGVGDSDTTGCNHQFSPEERDRLNAVESIDILPPNSHIYRSWLAAQPHRWGGIPFQGKKQETSSVGALLMQIRGCRQLWDRWFMMGSIGVCVGVICYLLKTMIELLARIKYVGVRFACSAMPCHEDLWQILNCKSNLSRWLQVPDRAHQPVCRLALQPAVQRGAGLRVHLVRREQGAAGRRCRRLRGHGLPQRMRSAQGAPFFHDRSGCIFLARRPRT